MSPQDGEPIDDAEHEAVIARGKRIEECWRLTMEWWEKHDPEALRQGFRRDIARVIRNRDHGADDGEEWPSSVPRPQ